MEAQLTRVIERGEVGRGREVGRARQRRGADERGAHGAAGRAAPRAARGARRAPAGRHQAAAHVALWVHNYNVQLKTETFCSSN